MARIIKWKEGHFRKVARELSRLFRSVIFLAALLSAGTGVVLLSVAENTHYTYLDHIVDERQVDLRPGQIANLTFVTIPYYPTNISFSYLVNDSSLHYSVYELYTTHPYVLVYVYNSILLTSGNITHDQNIILNASKGLSYYSTDNNFYQSKYMLLRSLPGMPPTTVEVIFETTVPEHSTSNPVIGDVGVAIVISGIAMVAYFVTREAKRREKGFSN